MRRLPSKAEIFSRAKEIAMEKQVITMGVEPITPTEKELKESGVYQEARLELMRGETTAWESEQTRYIYEMASQMGLKLISKSEYAKLQRYLLKPENHLRVKKRLKPTARMIVEARMLLGVYPQMPRPFTLRIKPKEMVKPKPRWVQIPAKPKPRKRHTSRAGKTMRVLKKIDGVKVFSFPDHIWKTRKPRKQKLRRSRGPFK